MEGREGGPEWVAVNHTLSAQSVSSIGEATAFQIRFETTGYENIRFSAIQRSTQTGPDMFALAYRIGTGGEWVAITNSSTESRRTPANRASLITNSYTDFNLITSQMFNRFELPEAVDDQEVVYLRLYLLNATAEGRSGNTSINDILIVGDEIDDDDPPLLFAVTVQSNGLGADVTANPTATPHADVAAGVTVQLDAGTPPTGYAFGSWTVTVPTTGVTITGYTNLSTSFTMPPQNVTVVANWTPIYHEVEFVLDGGTLISGTLTQQVRYGEDAVPPEIAQTLTRDGYLYNFTGWSPAYAYTNITSDTTITAQWGAAGGRYITIINGFGATASPNPARPGTTVRLSGWNRLGWEITGWTAAITPDDHSMSLATPDELMIPFAMTSPPALDVISPFVVIPDINHNASDGWHFIMPDADITVTAAWEMTSTFTAGAVRPYAVGRDNVTSADAALLARWLASDNATQDAMVVSGAFRIYNARICYYACRDYAGPDVSDRDPVIADLVALARMLVGHNVQISNGNGNAQSTTP
jgi:hypothetical protein